MSKKHKNTVVNETVEKVSVVCNVSSAPHIIFGCTVPAKGEYVPTDKDMEDNRGVMRLENAVKQGKLVWR